MNRVSMQLIDKKTISLDELKTMSKKMFGNLVKAVVDVEREIMVVDADLHADQEQFLLDHDSQQDSLWGINLHPDKYPSNDWIEFDSMINIRPALGNYSRSIDNIVLQKKIIKIVNKFVVK